MPSPLMDAIIGDLQRHKTIFDPVNVGEEVCDIIAEEILVCMDAQVSPDGTPWEPLSIAYEYWKNKHYPGEPMAVLEGHMKTLEQLKGTRIIAGAGGSEMQMTYGIDELARDLAEWFQEGNQGGGGFLGGITSHGQPPRPFYSISQPAMDRIDAYLDDVHRTKL
jgi:hypothetical protein